MRIIFMGTAELACRPLEALCRQPGFDVVAVVTQPDRPRGRELKLQPSPVKALAVQRKLAVLQPERARNPDFIAELGKLAPDLIVVVAFGQILPQSILDLPPHGCLNVHTSILPRHRGAAPIQWAILEGDSETGVTIMKMDAGLDTGPVVAVVRTPILEDDTSATVHDRLAELGAELLVRTIPDYAAGKIVPTPQPAQGVTYARKITKEDGRIDWAQPARSIHNRVRAFVPWPGAYTWRTVGEQRSLLKIWKTAPVDATASPGEVLGSNAGELIIACGEGALRVLELQREGARRMTAAQYLAGHPLITGEVLG
jgi:methionyl-tRNA formyltransferase